MNDSIYNEATHQEFFLKLWKSPVRRWRRYGRKFLFIVLLGIGMWMSLDLMAVLLMKPRIYPPFLSLLAHALLTIILSLIMTVTTHQLYLRLSSRFRLIRAFQSSQSPSHE